MVDFNEILYANETVGGNFRPERQMDLFLMALNQCSLHESGFLGPQFTWYKLFADGRSIRSRLYRALASTSWFGKFSNAKMYHISNSTSDHYIPSLQLGFLKVPYRDQPKRFRFKAMWLHDPKCPEVVSEAWKRGLLSDLGFPLFNCLQTCRKDLTVWNKRDFGHVRR